MGISHIYPLLEKMLKPLMSDDLALLERVWTAGGLSPDLNPIENLWAILARKVGNRLPVDDAELEKFFIEEWDAIPQKMIDDLVLSFVPRLKECVAQHGETISTAGCTRKHPVNRRL